MNTWFSSDHHFNHANILEYCKRPWSNVNDMNEELVLRWNRKVKPEDAVFYLGDFSFGPVELISKFRKRLNGKITLISGNHDRSNKAMYEAGFDDVRKSLICTINDKIVLLKHHPCTDPRVIRSAEIQLCGHVHQLWTRKGNIYNVGVDVKNFEPVSFEEVLSA